jgi:hypothetical protein
VLQNGAHNKKINGRLLLFLYIYFLYLSLVVLQETTDGTSGFCPQFLSNHQPARTLRFVPTPGVAIRYHCP